MSTELQDPSAPTTAALVGGILADLQSLVEQQFRVTRLEIEGELRRRASAAAALVVGLALCLVGGIVISIGLVYLLHTLTAKVSVDNSAVPLWGCFEIIGFAVLAIGGLMANAAKASLTKPKTN
jgi:hypothetical protein